MCLHANDVYIVPAVDVYYLIKEGGNGQGGGGGGREVGRVGLMC